MALFQNFIQKKLQEWVRLQLTFLKSKKQLQIFNQSSGPADDLYSATVRFDQNYILWVKWSQKRLRIALSVGATQLSVDSTPTTPRKDEPGRRNKFVTSASRETRLFFGARRDGLLVGCTVEALYENEVLNDMVCNARRPREFFVSRVANKNSSAFAFLQATMITAFHRAYAFL